MAEIYYGEKMMNQIISHLGATQDAIRKQTSETKSRAEANLAEARGSTRWRKIFGPEGLTEVSSSHGDIDGFVNLEAPNPMAIEYGHSPSGVFGPGGRYADVETKAPDGLYILNRAAGLL